MAAGRANGCPFVLDVSGQNAVVRNLRIKLPAGNQPRGLSLNGGATADALRHGRYAMRVTAVDAAGNSSAPATRRRKV